MDVRVLCAANAPSLTFCRDKSYDWKSWDGVPHGYEGLLADNYQAMLAVLTR